MRLQGGTVVNVEGELIADVLIIDGIINAVHKGVEVQCVTRLQQLTCNSRGCETADLADLCTQTAESLC